ncbi:MAG: hypothetical protein NVS9B10_16360 [Nevskia sp.]
MSRAIIVLLLAASALGACSKPPAAPTPAPAADASATATARELPPAPGEPHSASIPAASEKTLANGLRVIVVRRGGSPLVTAELNLLSGGEIDPPMLSGLADFTATLLTQGTKTRSAPQLAQAAEALGGAITAAADWNATHVSITVTTPKAAAALDLLGDVVRNPVFARAEVERQRAQSIDALRVALSQPRSLATLVAARVAYGDAPYGHARSGTPASLARIKAADLQTLHRRVYRPDNAVLLFAGDIEAGTAFALAERSFGSWVQPATPLAKPGPAADIAAAPLRIVVVDLPDAGQSAVLAVHRTAPRSAADYYDGLIANAVLGGGYSARLNEEIRIKRGLSYGAGSRFQSLRDGGALLASAQTKNESAAAVVGLMLAELARLSSEPVPAEELKARKASLIGEISRSLETTEGLAGQLASLVTLGVELGEINHAIEHASAITPEQVQGYAKAHLDAAGTGIVIVGDGKAFLGALRKTYPQVEVIPASRLDLDSTNLGAAPKPAAGP